MAVKNEFVACLQTVEECILICRPRNPAAFIVQYLQDEYEMNSDGAESIDSVSCHMLHMLPFVYKDVMLFREYCSILFLNLMEKYRLGGIEPLIPISCLEAVFSGLTLRAHWEQNQIINDWILAKMPSDSVNFSQMTGIMQNFIQENIAYNFVKILFLHVLRKISQYPLSQSNSYQVDVAALRSILLKLRLAPRQTILHFSSSMVLECFVSDHNVSDNDFVDLVNRSCSFLDTFAIENIGMIDLDRVMIQFAEFASR